MPLERLAGQINQCFGEPFLPKGFVSARVNDQGDFILRVGARDVQVRNDGSWVGQGTDLTRRFDIVEHNAESILIEEN